MGLLGLLATGCSPYDKTVLAVGLDDEGRLAVLYDSCQGQYFDEGTVIEVVASPYDREEEDVYWSIRRIDSGYGPTKVVVGRVPEGFELVAGSTERLPVDSFVTARVTDADGRSDSRDEASFPRPDHPDDNFRTATGGGSEYDIKKDLEQDCIDGDRMISGATIRKLQMAAFLFVAALVPLAFGIGLMVGRRSGRRQPPPPPALW